jgi:hypothetical protein
VPLAAEPVQNLPGAGHLQPLVLSFVRLGVHSQLHKKQQAATTRLADMANCFAV